MAELFDSFLDPNSDPKSGYLALVRDDFDPLTDCAELDLQVFMSLVYFASYSFKTQPDDPEVSECRLAGPLRSAWEGYNQSVMGLLVSYMRVQCNSMGREAFPLN